LKIRISGNATALAPASRAHIQRQLTLALGGFGADVASVVVKVSGGAGEPRRCELEVGLRPRMVHVEDTDIDLQVAVDNAVRRISRAVGRALERERTWQDGHPSPPSPPRAIRSKR
jgi:ribosome-associated translation inhibitor RaiA